MSSPTPLPSLHHGLPATGTFARTAVAAAARSHALVDVVPAPWLTFRPGATAVVFPRASVRRPKARTLLIGLAAPRVPDLDLLHSLGR